MTRIISKLFLLLIPFLASCYDSGESQKLAEGKELGSQAVVALEQYKSVNGRYPKSLADLYPKFLKAPLKELRPGNPAEGVTFLYERTADDTYTLLFHYTGPGVNNCELQPGSKPQQWKCSGFY